MMPKHLSKERKHFGCHPGSRLDYTKHTLFIETYPPPRPHPIRVNNRNRRLARSVQNFRALPSDNISCLRYSDR